jgi:hypothetical protein
MNGLCTRIQTSHVFETGSTGDWPGSRFPVNAYLETAVVLQEKAEKRDRQYGTASNGNANGWSQIYP